MSRSAFSLVSDITKDIPQIVFAIVVACLTAHFSSGVQILKSLHGVIVPFIRMVKITHDMKRKGSDHYEYLKWFEKVLCCILCTCSVLLFIVLFVSLTYLTPCKDFKK